MCVAIHWRGEACGDARVRTEKAALLDTVKRPRGSAAMMAQRWSKGGVAAFYKRGTLLYGSQGGVFSHFRGGTVWLWEVSLSKLAFAIKYI